MRIATTLASGRDDGKGSVARRNRARAAAIILLAGALARCRSASGAQEPANELPFGHVEVPADGAEVRMLSAISGWALDDRGIREIRVYLDGHIVNTGQINVARPDVSRAYPRYARPGHRSGWGMLMGYDTPGRHTVLVQAVDSDGATRDIGVVNVTAVDK